MNLTWTTAGWTPQTHTTHDGVDAAQSGSVFGSSTSTLLTTVTGPGTLTFWWRNPSYNNQLSFRVGTTNLAYIIVYPSWQQQTFYLGPGSQTLSWVQSVSTPPGDSYRGYLDEVSYTAGATAPIITAQPIGQSQVAGLDTTFTVSAGGTPPLSYQWAFNGTNIPGATASAYIVTNAQVSSLGNYSVTVTNSVGFMVSSNAPLELGQVTAWGAYGSGATSVATGATNVLGMAAGLYCNLLLKADGTLPGWGLNTVGQTSVPSDLTNAIAIALNIHGLALRPDGTVTAWGGQGFGETNVPAGLSNVVAISAGRSPHSLALKSDGTVAAWGGYRGETNLPAGLSNVVAIVAGNGYDLALKADGTVTNWGNNPPGPLMGLSNVVGIAAGGAHALALLADGTVRAWGHNYYGQATVPAGLTNVVAVAAGTSHSLALRANGTVVGWGDNNLGQTNVPIGLTNVVAIAAGADHNLAQVGDGPPLLCAPVSHPSVSGAGFSLEVASQCGRVYALEYKEDLGEGDWVALPLTAGTGGNLVLRDPTASNTQRFYRVRRW